jgi:hypothetical protein
VKSIVLSVDEANKIYEILNVVSGRKDVPIYLRKGAEFSLFKSDVEDLRTVLKDKLLGGRTHEEVNRCGSAPIACGCCSCK